MAGARRVCSALEEAKWAKSMHSCCTLQLKVTFYGRINASPMGCCECSMSILASFPEREEMSQLFKEIYPRGSMLPGLDEGKGIRVTSRRYLCLKIRPLLLAIENTHLSQTSQSFCPYIYFCSWALIFLNQLSSNRTQNATPLSNQQVHYWLFQGYSS